jgi:hypothetical protein
MDVVRIDKKQYKLKTKRGVVAVSVGESIEISGSVSKSNFVITQPGEYEVEGISVFAYATPNGIAGVVQADEVKILVTAGVLPDTVIEDQGNVDAVIVDTSAIESKQSVAMIGNIDTYYVIPCGEKEDIALFIKDFEHSAREVPKLTISRGSINTDITEVVILNE